MQYDSSKRTIQLSIDTSIKYNKEKFARGYLHELLHHFTVEALQSPQNEREVEFQKSINKLYNNAKSLLKDKELYGLTNTFEFVSEIMTNKEFQEKLKSSQPSFWQKLINLFTKLLTGKEIYNNAVEEIMAFIQVKAKVRQFKTVELEPQILPLKEDKVKDQTQTIIDNAPRYNLEVESIKRTKKFLEKQIQRLGDKLKTKGGSEQEEIRLKELKDKVELLTDKLARILTKPTTDVLAQAGIIVIDEIENSIDSLERAIQAIKSRNKDKSPYEEFERLIKYNFETLNIWMKFQQNTEDKVNIGATAKSLIDKL